MNQTKTEQMGSSGFSEVIEEISIKTAEKVAQKQFAVEQIEQKKEMQTLKEEVAELKALKEEVIKLKSLKSKSGYTGEGMDVRSESGIDSLIREACKSFDNPNNNVARIVIEKDKMRQMSKAINTSQVINTYNNPLGGYSLRAPNYLGLINTNAITYAPVLALCGKVVVGLNGGSYVGFDNSKVNVAYSKECTEYDASALAALRPLEIQLDSVAGYFPYSKKQMRASERGESYFDFITHNEQALQGAIDRKVNNEIIKELKLADKYKNKFVSKTSNVFDFDDLFSLAATGLKPAYEGNAVFICNKRTLASLATLKGGNGQYVWKGIFTPSETPSFVTVSSPAGTINIIGISQQADENFDSYVVDGTNSGKLIGVYADLEQFIKVAYSPSLDYSIQDISDALLTIKDMGLLAKIAYIGFNRVVEEAGVSVTVKS